MGKAVAPHCALPPLVPPSFKQVPGGPQEAVQVRAGDKAILSCETDSLPEPTVTWFKDRQPLALGQRIRGLQGGQKLEILDSQVSGPRWAVWAVGTALPDLTGPGEEGGRCVGVCYNVEVPSPYPKRIHSAPQVSWDRPGQPSAGLQPQLSLTHLALSRAFPYQYRLSSVG